MAPIRFATNSRSTFYLPKIKTNCGKFNVSYDEPKLWNDIGEGFQNLKNKKINKKNGASFPHLQSIAEELTREVRSDVSM